MKRSAGECCEGDVRGLDNFTSQEVCVLLSGNDGRGSEMNDCFEERLRSFDESRLEELDVMSTTDVEDILGARVPPPITSL